MLKTIIDVIEVDSDSNVEVRLKLLNEIGSTPTVITNFNEISENNNIEADSKVSKNGSKSKKSSKNSAALDSNIGT